jgi:hypothetical protein
MQEQALYDELALYTLTHPSPRFIHQHVVDACSAQQADEHTKWITLYFALVGLYLFVEKNYTGKQIQNEHIRLSNRPKEFIPFPLPLFRGHITIQDVLAQDPGIERDQAIADWCASVWQAYSAARYLIVEYVDNSY